MGKRPYKSWQRGVRHPRFVKGYPLQETTGVRRYKKHAIKRALLRQPRPRIHTRGPFRTRTTFDTEALRMQRAADVKGSGEERIFYQALVDRGFAPEVDFTYQADEFGGRAELGGLVADFLFPVPRVIVQVQSYWHRLSAVTEKRDTDQSAILQSLGYIVLEIWGNTINDPAALEDWMDRNVMHLWGTSATPLTGSVERDEAFAMSTAILRQIEQRIAKLEEAVSGEVITESELGTTLQGFDISEKVTRLLDDIRLGDRLEKLESALFSGGAGGPAVRISSAYIAQHLSSSNFATGVSGWRISRDGTAEFQDLIARGTMQSDNFVSGSEGWRINEDGDAEFHDVTVRGQIIAATFKHDAVSTIGGAMMIGPATNVAADITDAATALEVVDATFANGDFLYIKVGGTYEVMEVTAGGGTTSLTVTRGIDGVATAWKKGTAVVRKGDRILLDTVSANSPYMDIIDWAGPLHDDEATKVRLGNLAGISDPDMSPSGYGLYSDNAFLSGTAVFAAGKVKLSTDGITLVSTEVYGEESNLKWKKTDGTLLAQVYNAWSDLLPGLLSSLNLRSYAELGGQVGFSIRGTLLDGGGFDGYGIEATYRDRDDMCSFGAWLRLPGGTYPYIFNVDESGDLYTDFPWQFKDDIILDQGKRLYFDTDLDSYIYCVADDSMQFYTGGAARMALTNTGLVINSDLAMLQGKKIYLDADLDSFIYCPGTDDYIDIYTAGARRFRIQPDGKVILISGTAINEFSTDGTLAGNSNNAVPTENAVKAYVDGKTKGVFVYRSGNYAHTSLNAVPFNAEVRDDAAFHAGANNYLQVPAGQAGWYTITGKVNLAQAAGDTFVQAYIQLNAGAVLAANITFRSGGGTVNANVAVTFYLNVGDRVRLHANWSGAGTRTVYGTGAYDTWFGMVKVG